MHRRGFTIIELMIALVISSVVFSAAIPLIYNTITANRAAKLKVTAYETAQREIEATKNADIATLATHAFTVPGIPEATGLLTVSKNASQDLANVSSKVNWSFKGKNQNIELKTYKYGATQ